MPRSCPFVMDLAYGTCVGVRVPDDGETAQTRALMELPEAERHYAEDLAPARRRTFVGGRMAIHRALDHIGAETAAVLPNGRGAPILPAGIAGSISHKQDVAVGLVARDTGWTLGVDLEDYAPRPRDISSHVLTAEERDDIAGLSTEERGLAIMVRFSVKEALYKAIDPYVQRYVSFKDVHAEPREDGDVDLRLTLAPHEPALEVHARWMVRDGLLLTSARARRADRGDRA